MKLLATKYKTYEGAHNRAGFENAMAKNEFEHEYKTKLWRYHTVACDNNEQPIDMNTPLQNAKLWRVARITCGVK